MKYITLSITPLLFIFLISSCSSDNIKTTNIQKLTSPNGELAIEVFVDTQQQAKYQISRSTNLVLKASTLGIKLTDRDLSTRLNLISTSGITTVSEQYHLFTGKQREVTYQANEQTYTFENTEKQKLSITFRVSDDGVAFRYQVLADNDDSKTTQVSMIEESTSFAFTADSTAWLQPIAVAQTGWSNTNPSYEEHYQLAIPVGQASPSSAGWVFPALFNTGEHKDTWFAITEANLTADFHASRLQAQSPNGEYKIGQPMAAEVYINDGVKGDLLAKGNLPVISPWRVIAIGDLATVANSTLGTDLAAPSTLTDTDFVKPGVSSWSWGLLKDDATIYPIQKAFVDHAADMNWQYTLVDADWDRKIGDKKLKELVDYAATKNIGVLVWYNSSGDWNITPYSPKGQLLTAKLRNEQFAKLASMGIKGVKIDFFAGDGQSMINYYHEILQDAAKHKLLVNFHGATLPRGWQRTYPHLLTVEAIKGFEMITFFQENADLEASHSAMLPFTRNLFDPMDFTPTTFNDIPSIERKTSNSFGLAQTVLFTSGIQHIVETPNGMKNVPEFIKHFLQNLPPQWHESKFIAGYPGKLAVFARRFENTWYITGINGENIEKTLTLDLSFLNGKSAQYIHSGKTEREMLNDSLELSKATTIKLNGSDGFVIKVKK
ncbi:glycoside hydrolase family 97 catalytic domain-containing protein [Colwellia sp. E150_009]